MQAGLQHVSKFRHGVAGTT